MKVMSWLETERVGGASVSEEAPLMLDSDENTFEIESDDGASSHEEISCIPKSTEKALMRWRHVCNDPDWRWRKRF